MLGVSDRGVRLRLARSAPPVWPSAVLQDVGTPEWVMDFAAQYPACVSPRQRFTDALADACA
jgi:hypothetical protein